jgi:hypothetical protein
MITPTSITLNTYMLDVENKIAMNIFGASQADLLYEIKEDVFIRPAGMFRIYLNGSDTSTNYGNVHGHILSYRVFAFQYLIQLNLKA